MRVIRGYQSANWIGADIRAVSFAASLMLRRFILDQNYIMEYRQSSRSAGWLYYLWLATSDCGRSLARWCGLIAVITGLFGLVYRQVGIDFGTYPTWFSPFYFSIVTITTLGFGDVVPTTVAGQLAAVAVPVFVQQRGEIYAEIHTTLQDPAHWPHEPETDRFSFDHTDLGGHMARQWQLPACLVDAISGHHQDDAGTRFEPGLHLASLIRDPADPVALAPVFALAQQEYGLDRDALDVIIRAAFTEAEEFAHKIV